MGTRKAYVGDQGTVTVWTKEEERVARVAEMAQDNYVPDHGGDDAAAQRRADEAAEAAIPPTQPLEEWLIDPSGAGAVTEAAQRVLREQLASRPKQAAWWRRRSVLLPLGVAAAAWVCAAVGWILFLLQVVVAMAAVVYMGLPLL